MEPAVLEKRKHIDWEQLGYELMTQIQDFEKTREICALKLYAFELEIQQEIANIASQIEDTLGKMRSLSSYLYDREEPVDDPSMLRHRMLVAILGIMFGLTFAASVAAHTLRLLAIFGWTWILAFAVGLTLSGLVAAVGYLLFERIRRYHWLEAVIGTVATALIFWGAFQLGQAGSQAATVSTDSATATNSYVEGESTAAPEAAPSQSQEREVKTSFSDGITKIFFGADLIVGILLGAFVRARADRDYAAWQRLKESKEEKLVLEAENRRLAAQPDVAQKHCMAGILRAMHQPRKKRPIPYHQVLPLAVLAATLVFVHPLRAQTIARKEAILIDVSGSIGQGGQNDVLFREYLSNARQLLLSEPPASRVVVSVITTDSFGSAYELLRGWTPEAHGVFTDDLNRARQDLAHAFERKSAVLTPVAQGTDIIGGLWHVKALLESGDLKNDTGVEHEIWIFSDMVNETSALPMPSLLATGSKSMLDQAEANGLTLPLKDYRIHVLGASTRGLTPQSWNAIKSFWTAYFHQCGAELVSYSPEPEASRSR